MIEIEECREYGDGQVLLLVTWGWVDKTAFRDANKPRKRNWRDEG